VSRRRCKYALFLPLAILALGTLIAWLTPLDKVVETYFYDVKTGSWPVGDVLPFYFFNHYGEKLSTIVAVLGAVVLLIGGIWKPSFGRLRRPATFALLMLVLGPGLLVNTVLKEHAGRPRPRQLVQFGGNFEYRHPWEFGPSGEGRYSFPSGHAAVAFFYVFPYFILLAKKRRAALTCLSAGLLFGLFMGFARMAQGAHWPSDVLWSFGTVYFCGYALARLMGLDRLPDNQESIT